MNTNMDSKILYGIAIFCFTMRGLVVSTAMRFPEASSLIPTSLAFTAIMMMSVTVTRIITDLKKRIEDIEGRVVGRNEVGSENRS